MSNIKHNILLKFNNPSIYGKLFSSPEYIVQLFIIKTSRTIFILDTHYILQ